MHYRCWGVPQFVFQVQYRPFISATLPSKFKKYQRVQVWMALDLMIYSICGFFDLKHLYSNKENFYLGFGMSLCAIIFYGLMLIFMFELWLTLTQPFFSNKTKSIFNRIIVGITSILCLYFLYTYFFQAESESALIEQLYKRGLYISIIFTIRVIILLKETKGKQDKDVIIFKRRYFNRQIAFFLSICISQIFLSYSYSSLFGLTLLFTLGFIFSLFQLMQKFAYLKLKTLFFRKCCSVETINLITQIEEGKFINDSYVLMIDLLKKAQTQELVKSILIGIDRYYQGQFTYLQQNAPLKCTFKYEIDIQTNLALNVSQTSLSQTRVLVKSYYPNAFKDILSQDGFDQQSLQETFDLRQNLPSISKAQESLGRSGAFFFFSQNNRLIIKTLTKEELKSLVQTRLPSYFQHLKQNPKTTIAKIYGLFKLSYVSFRETYLIVMENSFLYLNQIKTPSTVYDLKGSTISRTSKLTESVLKDNNFLKSSDNPIILPQDASIHLHNQLDTDSNFLKSLHYMDYSLLVAIKEYKGNDAKFEQHFPRLILSNNRAYSFSIIDYLQLYNCNKQCEFRYKSCFGDSQKLSCIEPNAYSIRFIEFCKSIIKSEL